MREIRSYGSVRGVAGDRYPYRDLACRPAGRPAYAPYLASSTSLRPQIMLASCLFPPGPGQ
jgi:hypothetical protein